MKTPEVWVFIYVFYLVAFSNGEEKVAKTKVDYETPKETFKSRVDNEHTNV